MQSRLGQGQRGHFRLNSFAAHRSAGRLKVLRPWSTASTKTSTSPATLYGLSPVVETTGRGTVVERLDVKGEQYDLSTSFLSRANAL